VIVGSVLALGLSRVISTYIPMLPAFDAAALGGGIAVVLLAALGAAYVPSRRAAAVDPVETLRN
jgi:ABC-type antimicrobial peptide transport system permease subunit